MDPHRGADERPQPGTLTEAIQQVADCPCDKHQGAFLAALAATRELVFRVVTHNMSLADGQRIRRVGPRDQVQLTVADVHGRPFLLAFPNIDAARRDDRNGTYVGVGRDQALAMIIGDPETEGILLVGATHNQAWAAAGKGALAAMQT